MPKYIYIQFLLVLINLNSFDAINILINSRYKKGKSMSFNHTRVACLIKFTVYIWKKSLLVSAGSRQQGVRVMCNAHKPGVSPTYPSYLATQFEEELKTHQERMHNRNRRSICCGFSVLLWRKRGNIYLTCQNNNC